MGRFQGDLPQRTYEFAIAVLDLVSQIPDGTIGWSVGKQLARSGTSIGANITEADGALTDAEFASICNIARREAAETGYWLRIAVDAGLITSDSIVGLINEAEAFHRILATIVRKTQQSMRQN